MPNNLQFYINGAWVSPEHSRTIPVVDPSTGEPFSDVAMGSVADVNTAVDAARQAFTQYSQSSRQERLDLLQSVIDAYKRRSDDMAETIAREIGAPISLARQAHVPAGLAHLVRARQVLQDYVFDEVVNESVVTREAVGVCAFITPWNWPMNQITCKVGPALAAGCTMVLKPSEIAPLSGLLFAEIMHEAGTPKGVFNLLNGDGQNVGQALAKHPGIDMVSFTGSTQAGIAIAKAAADTVKRVHQELGGKSPYLLLDDADFETAVKHASETCFKNSGQSCNAPTRLLVPVARQAEAVDIACRVARDTVVGDPFREDTLMGPVVSRAQFEKIQAMIDIGLREGATLAAGGLGSPLGLEKGFFVRPTVFADVSNDMTIARAEIFGPVLSILPYESEEDAIRIANDTEYGLSAYVSSACLERARHVARQIRAGMVHLNGARSDNAAPFGGYKRSGNGREWGKYGFEEFLEIKSMFGYC